MSPKSLSLDFMKRLLASEEVYPSYEFVPKNHLPVFYRPFFAKFSSVFP